VYVNQCKTIKLRIGARKGYICIILSRTGPMIVSLSTLHISSTGSIENKDCDTATGYRSRVGSGQVSTMSKRTNTALLETAEWRKSNEGIAKKLKLQEKISFKGYKKVT